MVLFSLDNIMVKKTDFSPLKPVVNTFITAIIPTLFTSGIEIPKFTHVLIRIFTMGNNDMENISTLVQNLPAQARVP